MSNFPKISVIVPLYNTEKYISQCLNSIVRQTYEYLEIIVVDDASTDGSGKIADEYAERDGRIKIIHKEKNEGLYHARITGVTAATGEYIGFVDSDDTVSVDYFRSLLFAAEDAEADITLGKTVEEDERGRRYIHNIYHYYSPGEMTGEEARRAYWEQEGACFIFHTVWNKLYTRRVWENAFRDLREQTEHLVMCEDFVFSSYLFEHAGSFTSTEYGYYCYKKHSGASTAGDGGSAKYEKNIRDMTAAFAFVERLVKRKKDGTVTEHFENWRLLYKRFWTDNVKGSGLGAIEKRKMLELLDVFEQKRDTGVHKPSYFYSVTTEFDDRYEQLTEAIASDCCEVVSFDIFDTAILRPFYRPEDLFVMLDAKYREVYPDGREKFSDIRINAEIETRDRANSSKNEEITLSVIYKRIAEICSPKVAETMKEAEIAAEMRYAFPRRSVYNLWTLARHLGRKVYFTSDMYLGKSIITRILGKCGYIAENILVSCDTGATKRSGKLFRMLSCECGVEPARTVHIGDSYEYDVKQALECGIRAYIMPRAVDCLEYNIPSIKSTHTANCYTEPSRSIVNYQQGLSFFGVRTALAVAACKLYDNPFISYNEHTEMNASPTYFGYYALGMHLLGFTKWLCETATEVGYDKLLFVARDGYLPMRAYEIIKRYYPDSPACAYLRTSRKATLAAEVTSRDDILPYCKRIDVKRLTPERAEKIFDPVIAKKRESETVSRIAFGSANAFKSYVTHSLAKRFDKEKAKRSRDLLRRYLDAAVTPRSAVVDVGYSARLQEIIYRETGKAVDALYVHINDGEVLSREKRCGFDVRTFYGFTPSISGAVRELLFSKLGGSTLGYEEAGDDVVATVEQESTTAAQRYLIREIQSSALEFIKDYTELFGDRMDIMHTRGVDISLPFEYFVHTLGDTDAEMFSCIIFEDDLWSGGSFTLADRWLEAISYHGMLPHYKIGRENGETGENVSQKGLYEAYFRAGMNKKGDVSKALFWLAADKGVFLDKLKRRILGDGKRND